jgi:hypothetical protein
MGKKDKSTVKTAAKAGGAFYAIKKLLKGAFVIAGIAAVGKVLRSKSAT